MSDRLILGVGYFALGLFVLAIIIPLVYVVAASFMDPTIALSIIDGMEKYLEENGISNISEIRGIL